MISRILISLKLLNTPVGVITLSSGICNDITGWILLALCVTLVNAGAGIKALYILLVAIGFTLFLALAASLCLSLHPLARCGLASQLC